MIIPSETIALINERADILEVVQDFVSLKKKGSNWMACCPFHNEKTPSFSVSPSKGIYKCFGCGKGGDSVSFVMDLENYTYPEALRYLADKYGIEIESEEDFTDEQKQAYQERESILIALDFAGQYYQEMLEQSEEGQDIGLSYFKERGFKKPVMEVFQLGYSLKTWDDFLKKALEKGFSEEILLKAGLILKNDQGKVYDRFRERVMFPIHNVSGKPIGFGARTLKKNSKEPKYLNSPETPVYQKSKILYGIHQAKKAIREQDNCYLVEGYTDVLSLHQADIKNVVASSGTSLTKEQIQLIRRFTENATILYDGDLAGIKASLRGVDLILAEGLNVKIVKLPDGEDPDSYVQKIGTSAFQKILTEQAEDFISFKTKLYLAEAKNDPIKRANMIRDVVQSIVKVPDEIKRRVFYQECSRLLGIEEQALIHEGNQLLRKEAHQVARAYTKSQPESKAAQPEQKTIEEVQPTDSEHTKIASQEKQAVWLLLNYGQRELKSSELLANHLLEELKDLKFEHPVYQEILSSFLVHYQKGKVIDPGFFIKSNNATAAVKQAVVDLISIQHQISNNWEEKHFVYTKKEESILDEIVEENILRLKFFNIKNLEEENKKRLDQAEKDEEQIKYLKIGLKLEALRKQITQQLNNVVFK